MVVLGGSKSVMNEGPLYPSPHQDFDSYHIKAI